MVSTSFSTSYNYNTNYFWSVATGLFVLANIIIGVIWMIRLYIWTSSNPSFSFGENYGFALIYRTILILVDSWSEVIFYYLFIMTGYWFVFYKLQTSIFLVMPPISNASQYSSFNTVFSIMFIFRMIATLDLIYS